MKPLLKPLCRIAALIVLFGAPSAFADESDIEGRWLSGDKSGWIDIRLIDGKPVGTVAGSTTPEEVPRVDEFNPDPALRDRPLLGITILHGAYRRPLKTSALSPRTHVPPDGPTCSSCTNRPLTQHPAGPHRPPTRHFNLGELPDA